MDDVRAGYPGIKYDDLMWKSLLRSWFAELCTYPEKVLRDAAKRIEHTERRPFFPTKGEFIAAAKAAAKSYWTSQGEVILSPQFEPSADNPVNAVIEEMESAIKEHDGLVPREIVTKWAAKLQKTIGQIGEK